MATYKVTHRTHGAGTVVKIKNGIAFVKFGAVEKQFSIKDFDKYFIVEDSAFQTIINREKGLAATDCQRASALTRPAPSHGTCSQSRISHSVGSVGGLLGPRAQTIPVSTDAQMFELVGYLAHPGRISSIEAEVPVDGRDEIFEDLFPGQIYRPITLGDTPSGMPNKLSPQFRINIANIRNCPQILRENMGAGNISCVARINKSRFVIDLVQNYGFRFGDRQDVAAIRRIAANRGYLADFDRGYSL